MARIRGIITAVCLNEDCLFYHKEKGKDVVKRGFNRAGTQRYLCLHCNKYLVETKGTMMYRRRITEYELKQLCKLLIKKNGIRSMSRLMELNKNTVSDWMDNLARHSPQITDFLIQNIGIPANQVNEFWDSIKKNKKTLSPVLKKEITKVMRKYASVLHNGTVL